MNRKHLILSVNELSSNLVASAVNEKAKPQSGHLCVQPGLSDLDISTEVSPDDFDFSRGWNFSNAKEQKRAWSNVIAKNRINVSELFSPPRITLTTKSLGMNA